jgi:hypothetical protein
VSYFPGLDIEKAYEESLLTYIKGRGYRFQLKFFYILYKKPLGFKDRYRL